MVLVWAHGATVLLAGCQAEPLARPTQPVEVLAARWDSSNDCFILEARIPIHLPGGAELLAGRLVSDFETGLFQSYLVFEQNSCLSIWCLDPDDGCCELLAELSLPSLGGPSATLKTSVQDCWLGNGPTVFAVYQGQLLVATLKGPDTVIDGSVIELPMEGAMQADHVKPMPYAWDAHLLAICEKGLQQSVRIHFCGEIRRDAYPEAILSVGAVSNMQSKASSSSGRCLPSWSYLSASENDQSNSQRPGESTEQRNKPLNLAFSEHIPTELDPKIISCILTVPATPCLGDDPNDVLIGTKDGRLLRCRLGRVIKVVNLEGIPTQLHFAVVAEGQGVIVVFLDNSQQNVLAICAESHQILQGVSNSERTSFSIRCRALHSQIPDSHRPADWSRIWQVAVGDFSLSGHDQIIVFQGSGDSVVGCGLYTPLAQNGLDIISIHGFSNFMCPDTPQGSQQHLKEVKAINEHQVAGLEAIVKALNKRVEIGLAELKVAEKEVQPKRDLYRLSNHVMQGMSASYALEKNSSMPDDKSIQHGNLHEDDQLQVVKTTRIENRICGMTWFLLVDVEILDARSSNILHYVSLHVTSLNGSISGRSTVLKSLSYGDGSRRLVMSVPLQTMSLLPGFPFHIFLNAGQVSISKGSSKMHSESCQDVHLRHRNVYTQWLGCSQVINPTSLRPLPAEEASELMEKACEQRQFLVAAIGDQSILQLAGILRSTLFMQDSPDDKHERSSGMCNLMSVSGLGIAIAHVTCIGKHAVIILKTSNPQLMAMLEESVFSLIPQHEFRLLPRMCHLETLEKVSMLADALVEELGHAHSLKQANHARLKSQESRHQDEQSYLQLQMDTDRKCSEVLSLWSKEFS